jgi:hypothetical protein
LDHTFWRVVSMKRSRIPLAHGWVLVERATETEVLTLFVFVLQCVHTADAWLQFLALPSANPPSLKNFNWRNAMSGAPNSDGQKWTILVYRAGDNNLSDRCIDDLREMKMSGDLMAVFYEEMLVKRQSPAAALRAAQLELSKQKRYQSPYFWAGFVLQGEWK